MVKKFNIKTWYIIFTFFILLVLIFPIFALGNSANLSFLGMPFIMVWVLFWIIVEFLGLLVFVILDKDVEE